MTVSTPADADRAVKSKQRAVWAMGDYPAVAAATIRGLGARLVEASGVSSAVGG